MIKMIVCSDINGAIGYENKLLFNIKEDLQFFKKMTTGHKIVMGYNTWMSLPKKPLPNREHYILTSRNDIIESENVHVIRSIEDIVELGKYDDIFIIGGGKLYNDMIYKGLVDEVYLTLVADSAENADTYLHLFEMSRILPYREFIQPINDGSLANIYKYYKR